MADERRRATVLGLGLIGGSVGLALRAAGWHVTGEDRDTDRTARALERGAVDAAGIDPASQLAFVATPVAAVVPAATRLLAETDAVVTDVGSVKTGIVEAIDDGRFVGGHPMAGSEQDGIDAATADLFEGATWVLTPAAGTDESAYTAVRSTVSALGAEVVALAPDRHDALVAVVSHVPHLTAATLMRLADDHRDEHQAVLRLAAGGFRDMTRVAAGHPAIWPDICVENRTAITDVLDRLTAGLAEVRAMVADHDRDAILDTLESARVARLNLPVRYERPDQLAELRITIPDQPGALADVTTLATELDVNIADLEIAHSAEGEQGVLIVLVEHDAAPVLHDALADRGYRVSSHQDLG